MKEIIGSWVAGAAKSASDADGASNAGSHEEGFMDLEADLQALLSDSDAELPDRPSEEPQSLGLEQCLQRLAKWVDSYPFLQDVELTSQLAITMVIYASPQIEEAELARHLERTCMLAAGDMPYQSSRRFGTFARGLASELRAAGMAVVVLCRHGQQATIGHMQGALMSLVMTLQNIIENKINPNSAGILIR